MVYVDCDSKEYNVNFVEVGGKRVPLCPVCGEAMRRKSLCRGDTVWECSFTSGEDLPPVKCNLIEGRLDIRRCVLWGVRYEARSVNSN